MTFSFSDGSCAGNNCLTVRHHFLKTPLTSNDNFQSTCDVNHAFSNPNNGGRALSPGVSFASPTIDRTYTASIRQCNTPNVGMTFVPLSPFYSPEKLKRRMQGYLLMLIVSI
jgi:hypothetical protein